MLELQMHSSSNLVSDTCLSDITPSHVSFPTVYAKIKRWLKRFYLYEEDSIFNELCLFYHLSNKSYLDHRSPQHISRVILSIYFLHAKLQHAIAFSADIRHLTIRWIPAILTFPFSSKSVLGCLVAFNVLDRYELFDEENVKLVLEKYFPNVRLVGQSFYSHTSRHKNLRVFYFELEKSDQHLFTPQEKQLLKSSLEEKIRNSIQQLSPSVFMSLNEEEVYKNVLALSREIESPTDIPQAHITLERQSSKDITFHVILVYVAPFHRLALKDRFFDCTFQSTRRSVIGYLDAGQPIELQIFRLVLPRNIASVRSDGSLDFYSARARVVNSLKTAIGEFRDFNGGILLQQQEAFAEFKQQFLDKASTDPELLAMFFYTLVPIEKRVFLRNPTLATLFSLFWEHRYDKLPSDRPFAFHSISEEGDIFITIHSKQDSLSPVISSIVTDSAALSLDMVHHFINITEGSFFNCVILKPDPDVADAFLQNLKETLHRWAYKKQSRKVLRIGTEYWPYSLDPRIGGDNQSSDVLRLLFEGLTRFNRYGEVENGLAESIEVSSDQRCYLFKLRTSFWNDGSPLSAHDFEYAWKHLLDPSFVTPFASFFYLIQNAKAVKEGDLPSDALGVEALNDQTLRVHLSYPAPYFLHLTALPLYSPVHRHIDQHCPEWPFLAGRHYPCNGPFQIKAHQLDQSCQLIKNPFYWDARKVTFDQVVLKQLDPYRAIQAFRKNELDWIGHPLGIWHPFYTPGPDDRLVSFPNQGACWSIFNTHTFPFNQPKFREAVAHVIDRAQLVARAPSSITPAHSLLLPSLNHNRQFFPSFDPEAGRRLLKEMLEECGIQKGDIPPISLIFHPKGIREYTAQFLKEQIETHLGLPCDLDPQPWKLFFRKVTEGQFQMGLFYWTSRINDPVYTLNAFRFADGKISNLRCWECPRYQALLDQSDQEISPFQRSAYLLEAEELLSREMPAIPLYYQPAQMLLKKSLRTPDTFYEDSSIIHLLKHEV